MGSWWNSPDTVGTVAFWAQVAGVTFAVLAALFSAIGLTARIHRETLLGLPQRVALTEQLVKPRRLSDADRARLAALLAAFAPGAARFDVIAGDIEARTFAEQLATVLAGAGFTVAPLNGFISPGREVGLTMLLRDTSAPPPYAVPLQKMLMAMGLGGEAAPNPDNSLGPNDIAFKVGNKPVPE